MCVNNVYQCVSVCICVYLCVSMYVCLPYLPPESKHIKCSEFHK